MLEIGGFFGLLLLVLNVWAIISTIGSTETTGKKVFWTVLIIVLPLVGFIAWLIAGPRGRVGTI